MDSAPWRLLASFLNAHSDTGVSMWAQLSMYTMIYSLPNKLILHCTSKLFETFPVMPENKLQFISNNEGEVINKKKRIQVKFCEFKNCQVPNAGRVKIR